MDEQTRRQILEYVKPLAVGLDGTTYSGDVERTVAASERIGRESGNIDSDLVYLLAVFSGQDRWVQRMGHASRTEIFLSSIGIPEGRIQALFRGLARLRSAPVTREEDVVYDAVVLAEMGAYGLVRHLLEGYRERLEFLEMAESIEQAARRPMRTPEGERLAVPRRRTMLEFAESLKREWEEFRT